VEALGGLVLCKGEQKPLPMLELMELLASMGAHGLHEAHGLRRAHDLHGALPSTLAGCPAAS